jgi:hypothetical protein
MKRLLILLLVPIAALAAADEQVSYFPSLMYGHILAGAAASRYETTLILNSEKGGRAQIELFSEKGEPMEASFTDPDGNIAATGSSFAFVLQPERTLLVKLQLPEQEASDDVAIRTGWATVTSVEELEVSALVRVTTPQGKLLSRYLLSSEKPTRS